MHILSSLLAGVVLIPLCLGQTPGTTIKACTGRVKSPAPPKNYCGSKGTITKPKLYQTSNHLTLQQCRDGCLTTSYKCQAFGYNSKSMFCYYYSSSLEAMTYKPSMLNPNGVVYYDRTCYNIICNQACSYDPQPAVYTFNSLVENASFEQGESNWNNNDVAFLTSCDSNDYPYDGTGFARMTNTGDVAQLEQGGVSGTGSSLVTAKMQVRLIDIDVTDDSGDYCEVSISILSPQAGVTTANDITFYSSDLGTGWRSVTASSTYIEDDMVIFIDTYNFGPSKCVVDVDAVSVLKA